MKYHMPPAAGARASAHPARPGRPPRPGPPPRCQHPRASAPQRAATRGQGTRSIREASHGRARPAPNGSRASAGCEIARLPLAHPGGNGLSRLYITTAAHPYHPPGAHLRHTPTPGRSEGACAQRGRGSPQLLPLGPKRPTTHGRPPKGLLLILHIIALRLLIKRRRII